MPDKDCKFCGLCLKIFPALNLEDQNHMERWVSNSQENMITATQREKKKTSKNLPHLQLPYPESHPTLQFADIHSTRGSQSINYV